MFGAVIAAERLLDRLNIGTTSQIAQGRQHSGITFAGQDRTDDPHPGRPGDVGNDVVNLQVHLHQSLLHVLDMRCRILEQTLALTDIRSQLGDPTLGPKAGAQQTIRMKPLQPLRITDVGLASIRLPCRIRMHAGAKVRGDRLRFLACEHGEAPLVPVLVEP